jgi:hypothetical protein
VAYQLLFHSVVKRYFAIGLLSVVAALPLQCATLEQLSMADLIAKSTAIVRAKVVSSYAAKTGPVIYTHYLLQVSERYKGAAQSTMDLAVPGGVVGDVRQVWGGAPQLDPSADYVLFLWTGKSGLTQVMGLSQGLFTLAQDGSPDPAVTHRATHELMLDHATGRPVPDHDVTIAFSALKAQIAAGLQVSK